MPPGRTQGVDRGFPSESNRSRVPPAGAPCFAAGAAGGIAATRLLENLLFSVRTYDPVTYGSVSVMIASVAFVAGWLPARRAARMDPLAALRRE